jgi:hypothetical protein
MAAHFIFDFPFHAVCQKNLYDLVQSLKSRSDNDFDTFKTLLFNLDGAYETRERNGMLQRTHSLITNAMPTRPQSRPTRISVALTRCSTTRSTPAKVAPTR